MELDFDKEIDALLRNTRDNRVALPGGDTSKLHLDADDLSAFAENALPERTRQSLMVHLAECDGCRKLLSNLIVLNSEAAAGPASPVTASALGGENIPWYRKLFLFPNLAYVMGSLVLVFSGFLGYLILQNSGDSMNADVSQIDETQTAPNVSPVVSERAVNSNMNSMTPAANAANTNTTVSTAGTANNPPNATRPESPAFAANAATGNSAVSPDNNFLLDGADATARAPAPILPSVKEKQQLAKVDEKVLTKNEVAADAPVMQSQRQSTEMNRLSGTSPAPDAKSKVMKAPAEKDRSDIRISGDTELRAKKSIRPETAVAPNRKQVNGRNFELKQGVWYDTAYRGQGTRNVRRGTGEYRKLDSGLRAIAESFAGTVVAVWKDKAYRIQ